MDKLSDLLVILTSSLIISYILRVQLPFIFRIDLYIFSLPIDKMLPISCRSESIISKRYKIQWFFYSMNGLYKKRKILNDPYAIGLQSQLKKDSSIAGPILAKKIRDSAGLFSNDEKLAINSVLRAYGEILQGDVTVEMVTVLHNCILSRLGYNISENQLSVCYESIFSFLRIDKSYPTSDDCLILSKLLSSFSRGKANDKILKDSIYVNCRFYKNKREKKIDNQTYNCYSSCKLQFLSKVRRSYDNS